MTRRRVLFSLVVVGAGLLGVLPSCSRHVNVWEGKGGPPRVVVSFSPLYSFVKAVAPEAGVICLCTTTGPHEYAYNPKEMIAVRDADLLLANGLGLDEQFTEKLNRNSGNPRLRYLEVGEKIPEKELIKPKEQAKPQGPNAHQHNHGEWDPHVWLGIPEAIHMVKAIRDELKEVDPKQAQKYDENADKYIKELEKLAKEGLQKLKDKKDKKLISFHESLEYFARTFDLEIVDVIQEAVGVNPGAKELAALADKCIAKKVHCIAVEPQFPPAKAQSLLDAVKAKDKEYKLEFIEIDPLETADAKEMEKEGKDWYLKRMEQNLQTLADKLK